MSKLRVILILTLGLIFSVKSFADPSKIFVDNPKQNEETFDIYDLVDFEQGIGVYFGVLYRNSRADGPLTELCRRLGLNTYVKNTIEVQKIKIANNEFIVEPQKYAYSLKTRRLKEIKKLSEIEPFTLKSLWLGKGRYVNAKDIKPFISSHQIHTVVSKITCK